MLKQSPKPYQSWFEYYTAKALTELELDFVHLAEFDWLKTKSKALHLDFYIPYLHMGIEVQGAQHYYTHPYTRDPNCNPHVLLAKTQRVDQVKRMLCARQGIALVEIHCRHRRHKKPVESIKLFLMDVIEEVYFD